MSRPLAIDLFTGLHGWAEGLVAEGFDVVGFDLEDMCGQFGQTRPDHVQLVIQDVLTLHGSQFRDAALIVASPPCQAYSYRAMPWKRAKALPPPCNALFEACFRIQREACEAAGRHIPLVVENVRGAQKWVGRARWNFGSFYLWGDVPALMPSAAKAQKFNPDGTNHGTGSWFKIADSKNRGRGGEGIKVSTMGAGWYPPDHPKHIRGLAFNGHAERALKVPGFRLDGSGKSFQMASVNGLKLRDADGYERTHPNAFGWKIQRTPSRATKARKFASAMIAKIPLPLSRWIAATYRPRETT